MNSEEVIKAQRSLSAARFMKKLSAWLLCVAGALVMVSVFIALRENTSVLGALTRPLALMAALIILRSSSRRRIRDLEVALR